MLRYLETDFPMQINSFPSQAEQVNAVVQRIVQLVDESDKGVFNLVVTGGGLGIKTLEELGRKINDPSKLRIIFCDERFVDLNSSERNEAQAIAVWPDIVSSQLIRYPNNDQNVSAVAESLSLNLREIFGDISDPEIAFDLVLLGVGEDGHIASLFPGAKHPIDWVVVETNSPKAPKERLSLSYEALNKSERIWFVVGGKSKAAALSDILKGSDLPAAKVHGRTETIWWLDSELSDEL